MGSALACGCIARDLSVEIGDVQRIHNQGAITRSQNPLDMAIAELGRTGDFPVLVLNAHRFVHGMWAPRAIGDWLVDNPTARGAV